MNTTAILSAMGFLENLIFILLFILSVWSISVIWDRYKVFKKIETSDSYKEAYDLLSNNSDISSWTEKNTGLRAGTLKAALSIQDVNPEKVDRAVKSYLSNEKNSFEKGFTTLATLGSNAPFIGLLGTVLGIIQAFGLLSNQKSDTNALMASISFALIATAAGLFVAIPAVIAYNFFNRKLKTLISESESLKDLYLSKRIK